LEVRRRKCIVSDDTTACELIGQAVKMVISPAPNPKITRPEDAPFLELLLRRARQREQAS